MSTWQFVDSIASSPVVRLDLNSRAGGLMLAEDPDVSPPRTRSASVASMLADGELMPARAFTNRTIRMTLQLTDHTTKDLAAAKLQALARELTRQPGNFLRVTVATNAMFFRTLPAPDAAYNLLLNAAEWGNATIEIPCEPFGYGLRENLTGLTVYNDPAEGTVLNANPYFETDASDWTPSGGTFVRSTAQFHQGAASGLLTPSGASGTVDVLTGLVDIPGPGAVVRASAWMRCAVARTVDLRIDFHTSAGGFVSSATQSISLSATTWTSYDLTGVAPATAFKARIVVAMFSTPPAGHVLHLDEMRIRSQVGGMLLDIASPKGDVEAPLDLRISNDATGLGQTGRIVSLFAVRRRGNPYAAPFVLQAEAMTMGTNAAIQAYSASMSGAGSNFIRVTPGTTTMVQRLSTTTRFPATSSVDARGSYRVLARVRQNTVADVWDMRLLYGTTGVQITNDTVRLPVDTGPSAPTLKYIDLTPGQQLMQIPVGIDPVYDGLSGVELPTEGVFLSIQAQRVSGSGTLDIDVLLFPPADDRLGYVKWPTVQNVASDVFTVAGGPRPHVFCRNVAGDLSSTEPAENPGGGMMITPGVTNRVYFIRDVGTGTAMLGAGDSVTASQFITGSYYPRYLFPLKPATT